MLRFELTTADPDETAHWGRALAGVLRAGDVVRLEGPLGAGKTTLVRAIASGLGVDPRLVSSPTYVVVNEYPLPRGAHLVHVDAYRLAGEDLDTLGWDRLDPADIRLVEWADRIADALPPECARVALHPAGETQREIEVELPDAWRPRHAIERLAPGVTRCPTTNLAVAPGDPHFPFATERARMADLHAWMTGDYRVQRPIGPEDME